MNKTDKELTVEIVNTFVSAWDAKTTTIAIKTDELIDLIKAVYSTIHNLPE